MKKSVELPLKAIIIAILILVFLVVSALFFKEKFDEGSEKLKSQNTKNLDEITEEIIESAK
ncbi:MAG TPA: hypothetical protein EYH54_03645 [Nautiliaceae bacterium]|nr:hypothetical protein [Nautiliaceae bacterium]